MPQQALELLPGKLLSEGSGFGIYIYWGLLILFALYSLVLLYHWVRYAPKNITMLVVAILYFGGSVVFLAGLLGSLSL